jgi:hypothetical protein
VRRVRQVDPALEPSQEKRQRVYREWLDFGTREALTVEVQPLQPRKRPLIYGRTLAPELLPEGRASRVRARCALFAGPVSSSSMNPASSVGPALVSGRLAEVWIYLSGPAIGVIAATVSMSVVDRTKHPEERVAAGGDYK